MPFTWSIRRKLLFGAALVLAMVGMLSAASLYVLDSYKEFNRVCNVKLKELANATDLRSATIELFESAVKFAESGGPLPPLLESLSHDATRARSALDRYRQQLGTNEFEGVFASERHLLDEVDGRLSELQSLLDQAQEDLWAIDRSEVRRIAGLLSQGIADLPITIAAEFDEIVDSSRTPYRTSFYLVILSSLWALGLTTSLVWFFYRSVFRPIRVLHRGSRRVARGNFKYRIHLDTHDEMAELAQAFNDMTARFQDVYNDLDQQVRERSRQLIRSEQLASVGFLAAGVAHEINNPLASIAMCSESLEGRLGRYLAAQNGDGDVVRQYLRMIQDEAFRCKSITEKLLNFSRMGDLERHDTDVSQLVQDVVDMIGHLGKYRGKNIEYSPNSGIRAEVNPEQIKQVVLNLVVNALDSMDENQTLRIVLDRRDGWVRMQFADEGCGMTPEVLENIFEPFFTKRRDGQGTGLGLSISHRIVSQHGGEIEASSRGPGKGSTFVVRLPRVLPRNKKEQPREYANA